MKIPRIRFKVTIPWPEKKEDVMNIWNKIKEFFAWKRVSVFLRQLFKGLLLILLDELKDMAITTVRIVAEKGLPDDEEKRHEFERIFREKAKEKGYELKDSVLNLLREMAIVYLKTQ